MDNIPSTALSDDEEEDPKKDGLGSLEEECPPEIDPKLWDKWRKWEDLPSNSFLAQYKRGLKGFNVGVDNGLTNVNKYIYGTHTGRYYLIGADSGVGKTTISDFMFILQAWKACKSSDRKFRCYYCSFEIGKADKIARWISYYIFLRTSQRLPSDYILGRIKGMTVTPEHDKLVLRAYQEVMELMQDIAFIDHIQHPTKVFEDLIEIHYEKIGVVQRIAPDAEQRKKGKKGFITGFKPHTDNENILTILMVDHAALHNSEMGLDTKGTMDKASKYYVILRNLFGTTIVNIQQFSTDMLSANRERMGKKSETNIAPTRLDFGDSKATFRDADVVFGYVKPIIHLPTFNGYNLSKTSGLGDCMIAQYLMKNRYGPSGKLLPLFLDGCTGYTYDLPLEGKNEIAMTPWYERAYEIDKLSTIYYPR